MTQVTRDQNEVRAEMLRVLSGIRASFETAATLYRRGVDLGLDWSRDLHPGMRKRLALMAQGRLTTKVDALRIAHMPDTAVEMVAALPKTEQQRVTLVQSPKRDRAVWFSPAESSALDAWAVKRGKAARPAILEMLRKEGFLDK